MHEAAPLPLAKWPRAAQITIMRRLIIILGDQLDADSSAFDGFDPARDTIWMAEAQEESTHVWSSKMRTAVFLSAMRHFRDELRQRGWPVSYQQMETTAPASLGVLLQQALRVHTPETAWVVQPGDYRVSVQLQAACKQAGVPLELRPDRHFLCSPEAFEAHAQGRKSLRLEYFYREMRQRHGVLLDAQGKPEGGSWNYDAANRGSFGKDGPGLLPQPEGFAPDATTREVIALVNEHFATHPGTVTAEDFRWPVTPQQAQQALRDFVEHRLPDFGQYQDAMWTQEPFLYHSLLSSSLNLKLLHPKAVIEAAEAAYYQGKAPLAAVEGFIRQILGWREYVRGIYWRLMPAYLNENALNAHQPLPSFYWTGETQMRCIHEALTQTLRHGYAHHIQRLMVTGLFALLLGVRPREVHAWYLAVYVDAVEWVELPNTIGMSQFADGGVMASKPYAATGKYLDRMSNYCRQCPYHPAKATGQQACPFTTLYWDFLQRHRQRLQTIPRMKMQLRNLDRKAPEELEAIAQQATSLKRAFR